MDFSMIFQKLRSEAGLKQEEMAQKLGVSKSTIGMWETGKRLPSPELYEQVADYFNVDIDYLYGRSEIRQRVHYDQDGTAYVPAKDTGMSELRSDERNLLNYYNQLNDIGKAKAISDISDMTELRKYTEDTASSSA